MGKFIKSLILVFLLCVTFALLGCSKDDSQSSSSSSSFFSFFKSKTTTSDGSLLENNSFAKKISLGAPLFVLWDTTNKGYQNLIKAHPQAVSSNTIESLAKNDANIKNYFEILKRIFNTDKIDAASFASKGVFFFEELKMNSFPVAMYTKLERKINNTEVYNAIKEFAKENNFTYNEVELGGNKGASVDFKSDDFSDFTLYFLIKDNGVAISNRTNLVERYLDANFDSGYVNKLINEDEYFKKSYSKSLKENTTSFGFASLILNSNFLPDKKVQEELSKLPVKNLVLNQAFDNKDMLVTRVASFYEPKTAEQKRLADAFNSSNSVNAPKALPQDTMASITISMNLIKSLIKEFNVQEEVAPYMYLLDMDNINLTLQSPVGTMFPNIAIVADKVKDSQKIVSEIKSLIASTKGSLPIPSNAWQQKKINNLDTDYIITPFGVGVYLTKGSDNLLIASSEGLVNEMTGNTAIENATNLRSKYSVNKSGIFNMYGSSKSFAKTLRTLNATLASFAKGKDMSNLDDTIKLLEQSPDSVIDIFSEDSTIIGETKIVLE